MTDPWTRDILSTTKEQRKQKTNCRRTDRREIKRLTHRKRERVEKERLQSETEGNSLITHLVEMAGGFFIGFVSQMFHDPGMAINVIKSTGFKVVLTLVLC